jgi:hypothetical protein
MSHLSIKALRQDHGLDRSVVISPATGDDRWTVGERMHQAPHVYRAILAGRKPSPRRIGRYSLPLPIRSLLTPVALDRPPEELRRGSIVP